MSDGSKARPSSSFHFAAGLTTGTISAALLQPVDLLKTRVQQSQSSSLLSTLRAITSSPNAVRQLWRGTLPSVLRTGLGSALYFTSLNALRQNVAVSGLVSATTLSTQSSSSLPKLSNLANLTTGAVARVAAGMTLMPLTVIKVRYESNLYAYTSIAEAAKAILKKEGIKGFFAGFGATAARDAPYAGLYVLFYEQLKKRLSMVAPALPGTLTTIVPSTEMTSSKSLSINFTSGVLAAAMATAITNPFDAVKTRLQLMPGRYGNLLRAAMQMVREEGVRSLFDGLALRMARKAMSSALAWTLYEELLRNAERRWK